MELPPNEPFPGIQDPTLLIHRQIVEENLSRILDKTQAKGVRFRPHMKTHQHPEVGRWMQQLGIQHITVSSLDMAVEHARLGWKDITIALPCHPRQLRRLAELSKEVTLQVILDHTAMVDVLQEYRVDVGVWIELDTGSHRTGIPVQDVETIRDLIERIETSHHLTCLGFLWHDGHQYAHSSSAAIQAEWQRTIGAVDDLKKSLGMRASSLLCSAGDTPAASQLADLTDVDEIRAGNLVYYDLMQWQAGNCSLDQIGICLAAPVIGRYPDRGEIVVHGGAVHLSKEGLITTDGTTIFGLAVRLHDQGWTPYSTTSPVIKLSQEHGVIQLDINSLDKYPIGSLIGILPVHSCLTADAMRHQRSLVI
ncbi:MAG: alanine racemase [Saprospiraceae bacterium]|nr:alanine racemase [Saprospiraceae bacterium]